MQNAENQQKNVAFGLQKGKKITGSEISTLTPRLLRRSLFRSRSFFLLVASDFNDYHSSAILLTVVTVSYDLLGLVVRSRIFVLELFFRASASNITS
jgi:hypothetical protein